MLFVCNVSATTSEDVIAIVYLLPFVRLEDHSLVFCEAFSFDAEFQKWWF